MRRGTLTAWLATTSFAAAFLFANLPGTPILGPDPLRDGQYGPHFLCGVSEVVHGWPFTFLQHDGYFTPTAPIVSAWRIGGHAHFSPAALIANAALLAAGTLLVGWMVRRRIQHHGWRFGVFHVMAVTLCVSLIAATLTSRYRTHQAQAERCQRAGYSFDTTQYQLFGPYWLRCITGPQWWEWGDLQIAVDVESSDEIAELPGKSAIKVLRIENFHRNTIPSLDDYDSLLAINMGLANYDYSNFHGDGEPEFWPCLRVIAQCESIQALNLYDSIVTDRGLQELSRMPNLTHLELTGNREITDAGLEHLAATKSLRKLSLVGTAVTQDGINRLQAQLPECEIQWE